MSPLLEARRTTPMARALRLVGSSLLAAGAITVAVAGLAMLREPLAELGLEIIPNIGVGPMALLAGAAAMVAGAMLRRRFLPPGTAARDDARG